MYYKRYTGTLLTHKSNNEPQWIKWIHHDRGPTCCEDCKHLNGCLFLKDNAPHNPHHPYCHCILDPIAYTKVLESAVAKSQYSKFDPYLFNTTGIYTHTKEKLFAQWGYTVEDAKWLQSEMERQALEKYLSGDYSLGKLNKDGQRLTIRIEISRKIGEGVVSFDSGWMVYPNGLIQLTTPYGGK